MNKTKYSIIGISIILLLSVVYTYQMNREIIGKIGADLNISNERVAENYTDSGNQTSIKLRNKIKLRGEIFTGKEQEKPIEINSEGNWFVGVVFDSDITEKEAKETISKYDIPRPQTIQRTISYPQYYVSASQSDFTDIKNRLAREENIQLSEKIKITGENFTAAIWGNYDRDVPRLRSSGIPLKETMVIQLSYGPETLQTESGNIMQQLDLDEKIINTHAGYLFG